MISENVFASSGFVKYAYFCAVSESRSRSGGQKPYIGYQTIVADHVSGDAFAYIADSHVVAYRAVVDGGIVDSRWAFDSGRVDHGSVGSPEIDVSRKVHSYVSVGIKAVLDVYPVPVGRAASVEDEFLLFRSG